MSSLALTLESALRVLPARSRAQAPVKPARRQQTIFTVALAASALLHVAAFIHWQVTREAARSPAMPDAPVIEVALVRPVAPPTPMLAIPAMPHRPESHGPESVTPESSRPERPVPVVEPRPAPDRPRMAAPKSRPRALARPTPLRILAPAPATEVAAVSPPRVQSVATPAAHPEVDERLGERYLAQLLAHIESHKFYPLAARRRGIEGLVEVRFTLTADGRAESMSFAGGPVLLRRAAEETLQRAAPLPALPAGIAPPYAVRYGMRFALAESRR